MNGRSSPKRTEYAQWSSPKGIRKNQDEGNATTKQQQQQQSQYSNCLLQRSVIIVLVIIVLASFLADEIEISTLGSFASLMAIGDTYSTNSPSSVVNVSRSKERARADGRTGNQTRASKTLPLSTMADILPDLFPQHRMTENDTQHSVSSVYSMEAVSRLDRIKTKLVEGDPVTVVMNGGSSSAGAPNIPYEDRFFVQMVQRLERHYPNANITTVDRSHGARNTMHSAHLMHSLFPSQQHVDVVIWEFSINDGHTEADVRNQLIQWLRHLEAFQKEDPPLVIMVYLWQSPFNRRSEDGTIACRTFDQHGLLPAEYNFVLGHVNLAAYMDSLSWEFDRLNSTFLADRHHPLALTHSVLGKLLYQFVTHASSIQPVRKTVPTNKTDLTWNCRNRKRSNQVERLHQEFVKDLIVTKRRLVTASYTVDVPRNEPFFETMDTNVNGTTTNTNTTATRTSIPGMLHPNENVSLKMFGKGVEPRRDRQYGMILPCCKSRDATTTNASMPLSSSLLSFHVGSDRYIHALELTLRVRTERRSDIHIIYDGIDTTSTKNPTDLIRPSEWKCLVGGYNMGIGDFSMLDVDFVMVKRNVSSLAFCDLQCRPHDPLPMVSLSIY